MTIKIDSRQHILETIPIQERLELLQKLLIQELEIIDVDKRVQGRVKQQVEKSQRQYYLSEKIKAIQQELGELGEEGGAPMKFHQLVKNIKEAHMPKEAHEKAMQEVSKLKIMPAMSAEATVVRNYLEALVASALEKTFSKVNEDILSAEKILDADHYGLKEVKETNFRISCGSAASSKIKGSYFMFGGSPWCW